MSYSPIRSLAPAATRESLTANMIESGFVKELPVADFTRAFFRNPLPKDACKAYVPRGARKTITTITQSNEQDAYEPVGGLLNGICDAYAAQNHIAEQDQLAFLVHAYHAPTNHPQSYTNKVATQKPDLVLTKKWLALLLLKDQSEWETFSDSTKNRVCKPALAWHHILSLLEGKSFKGTGAHFQCATYLGSVMLARPDLIGCFGLAVSPRCFRLLWCDVSGVYFSSEISWTGRSAQSILVQYVHQLHTPSTDPSVRLRFPDQGNDGLLADEWRQKSYASLPVWYVKDAGATFYVVEKVLSVGDAWSRKNWVAEATQTLADDGSHIPLEHPIVIKDSFQRPERAAVSTEGDILQHIHRNGRVPGVMTMVSHFHVVLDSGQAVRNVPLPPGMDNGLRFANRVRYRLFLTWYANDQLYSSCPSAQDFLEVLYDVLEMLKHSHEEYDVTHRDISPFNILRRPDGPADSESIPESTKGKRGPVFVNQFLSGEDGELPPNLPSCVLIDFDNAFWDGKVSDAIRTATPGFLARTLSLGRVLDSGPLPPRIPTLEDEALKSYVRIHGQALYELASTFHDHIVAEQVAQTADIPHVPRHDAESCFWVIVWHLMLALPEAPSRPDDTRPMSRYFRKFEEHSIRDITTADERSQCFQFDVTAWETILHHDLKSLAPFIWKLAQIVAPDYSRWRTAPLDDYHLHEAMQRLILQEIWRLKKTRDPLKLNTTCQRTPASRSAAELGLAATAPRVHASRQARGDLDATNKSNQRKFAKRTRAVSPRHDTPSASTSAPADVKKRKTGKGPKDPAPSARVSERQRLKRAAQKAPK
ncbi:hypothetical protein AURDEDRAFT_183790 [Auricularia subglabra TFB-10046 SS5]|nr:hypothetical protein AURDEDRAFT_183790 [Auricularia subglabra TFB-10046 SS5]